MSDSISLGSHQCFLERGSGFLVLRVVGPLTAEDMALVTERIDEWFQPTDQVFWLVDARKATQVTPDSRERFRTYQRTHDRKLAVAVISDAFVMRVVSSAILTALHLISSRTAGSVHATEEAARAWLEHQRSPTAR